MSFAQMLRTRRSDIERRGSRNKGRIKEEEEVKWVVVNWKQADEFVSMSGPWIMEVPVHGRGAAPRRGLPPSLASDSLNTISDLQTVGLYQLITQTQMVEAGEGKWEVDEASELYADLLLNRVQTDKPQDAYGSWSNPNPRPRCPTGHKLQLQLPRTVGLGYFAASADPRRVTAASPVDIAASQQSIAASFLMTAASSVFIAAWSPLPEKFNFMPHRHHPPTLCLDTGYVPDAAAPVQRIVRTAGHLRHQRPAANPMQRGYILLCFWAFSKLILEVTINLRIFFASQQVAVLWRFMKGIHILADYGSFSCRIGADWLTRRRSALRRVAPRSPESFSFQTQNTISEELVRLWEPLYRVRWAVSDKNGVRTQSAAPSALLTTTSAEFVLSIGVVERGGSGLKHSIVVMASKWLLKKPVEWSQQQWDAANYHALRRVPPQTAAYRRVTAASIFWLVTTSTLDTQGSQLIPLPNDTGTAQRVNGGHQFSDRRVTAARSTREHFASMSTSTLRPRAPTRAGGTRAPAPERASHPPCARPGHRASASHLACRTEDMSPGRHRETLQHKHITAHGAGAQIEGTSTSLREDARVKGREERIKNQEKLKRKRNAPHPADAPHALLRSAEPGGLERSFKQARKQIWAWPFEEGIGKGTENAPSPPAHVLLPVAREARSPQSTGLAPSAACGDCMHAQPQPGTRGIRSLSGRRSWAGRCPKPDGRGDRTHGHQRRWTVNAQSGESGERGAEADAEREERRGGERRASGASAPGVRRWKGRKQNTHLPRARYGRRGFGCGGGGARGGRVHPSWYNASASRANGWVRGEPDERGAEDEDGKEGEGRADEGQRVQGVTGCGAEGGEGEKEKNRRSARQLARNARSILFKFFWSISAFLVPIPDLLSTALQPVS
ncbi:hypothetical protein B0H13DRAFT_1927605 [Mycena leptocephala]|nr:hypothetical protein B0H13DRAFT_1927605 [Mycena leptocephala]